MNRRPHNSHSSIFATPSGFVRLKALLALCALLLALCALPIVLASPRFAEVRKAPLSIGSYKKVFASRRAGLSPVLPFVANATNTYSGSSTGNITTTTNWSLSHVPTVSEDAVFSGSVAGGIRNYGTGSTVGNPVTVGSFDVTATSGTYSIRNNANSATNAILTLGGAGNLGNGVSGTASDLLYVATGATFALRGDNGGGNTGSLNVVLGQTGGFNAVGTMSITAAISDGGSGFGITKTGAGTLTLSGANTYTGATAINTGTLTCGAANTIPSGSSLVLNGGTFNSGATTGFTQSTGTLTLSDNSTIALGTGSHSLTFAASNGVAWTAGKKITVTGWTGGYNGTSGTAGKIFVGSDATGLTAAQLAQIVFFNGSVNFNATILSTGEVVPYVAPPSIAKSFGTSPINVSGTSLLSIVVTNPNSSTALTGVGYTDTLPTGLTTADLGPVSQCSGTVSVSSNVISLTGATIPASLTCTVSMNVTANGAATGVITNNTSAVTSTNGGTGNSASAQITVNVPDVTFNSSGSLAAGTYHDVTINNCSTLVTMTGNVTITGTLTINNCATLDTGGFTVSGAGSFVLAAGGTLNIHSANGITTSGASGDIQTASRSFSSTANYVYNGNSNQSAGNGLPASVTNLTVKNTGGGGNNTVTGNSGQTVTGTLEIVTGVYSSHSDYDNVLIDVGGTFTLTADITVSGNWTNNGTFNNGGFKVTFDGSAPQTIGGSNVSAFANLTISNTGSTVTLAQNVSDTSLNITSGTFDQGASFNVTSGAVTVSSGATWNNIGTGDLVLSGGVANAGSITFNGSGLGCGQNDDISITSSALGIQRAWSGAGNFSMTDVSVQDQGGTATIVVNSGTSAGNNGLNWVFLNTCAGPYTWTGSAGTDWTNPLNWSPARTTPAASDILVFGSNTPSPTVTNVAGATNNINETIAELHINNSSPTFSSGGGNTLTINAGVGVNGLDISNAFPFSITGANNLLIKLGTGTLGQISGSGTTVRFAGGGHKLFSNDPGAINFLNGTSFTTDTGFVDFPFNDGDPGQGAVGSVVFQSGSTYNHNAGQSPFGAMGNGPVATFQAGSTARWFTSSGFQASGRTYADLQIGSNATAVSVSDSGAGNFTFDNLTINSPSVSNSLLTFNGSGSNTVTIKGNVTSNGGLGDIPDIVLTAGSGGIVIDKPGVTVNFIDNNGNSRGIDFESNARLTATTGLNLQRKLLVGQIQPSSFVLAVPINSTMNGSAGGYVIGKLQKNFSNVVTSQTFQVGSVNGYAPIDVANSSGTGTLTINSIGTKLPSISGANALSRYWTISNSGLTQADLTFHYKAGDVQGTEANYKFFRLSGGAFSQFDPSSPIDTTNHIATLTGVTQFSDWTLAEPGAVNPGTIQFSSATYSTPEGDAGDHTVTITVTRAGGSDGAASVHYATSNGTATTADNDYDATSDDFNWADGDATPRTFNINVHGDTTVEPDETVNLVLSAANGAALGTPNSAVVTISNDDVANSDISVTKSAPTSVTEGNDFTYTITVTNSNSATATATGVSVTDVLQAGATFVSASAGCVNNTGTVTCSGADLLAGSSDIFTITVTAGSPGAVSNVATASASNDPNSPHSSNTTSTTINAAVCATPPAGMVSWWPGDGNAHDIKGGAGSNGTLQGGVTFANAKVNQGFNLNGTSGYVEVPDGPNVDITGAISIDAWIKPNVVADQIIVSKYDSTAGPTAVSYNLQMTSTGSVLWNVYQNGNSRGVATGTGVIAGGVFTHVAATFDPSNQAIKIYVNGTDTGAALTATDTLTAIENTSIPLRIGVTRAASAGGFAGFFNGIIDEVELFNTALSASDAAAIYNASFAGKCRTCTAPPTGMVGWWDGSGVSTTANDLQGSNAGTLQNGATFTNGMVGQAFNFTGAGQSVLVPDNVNQNTGAQLTADAWIYLNSVPSLNSNPSIINKRTNSNTEGYTFEINNAGTGLYFEITTANGVFSATAPNSVTTNAWHHVAATYDGASLKIFVDGNALASSSGSGAINSVAANLEIGRNIFTGTSFPGKIDEVELFNRALSPSEIAALADSGNAGKCHTSTASVSVSPASVSEDGAINLLYSFHRNGDNSGSATVNLSVGGDATFNTDYTQSGAATFSTSAGTVAFAAGESDKTITIDPSTDTAFEPNETVILTITSGTGYDVAITPDDTATGTISNDDPCDVPTPTASNGGPYCEGATISLSTPTVSGATYAWTGPNGFTSSLQNPTRTNATLADAGAYSVTVTLACTSAAGTTNVVVNAIPATPTASNGGPYCEGATISLSTPTVSGATYSWTGPNGFTSSLQNPTRSNATTADAGTYSVTVTVNGCTSAAGTTNVVVNPTPATPTASNGGPYCEGATISLSTPTVSGATYSWTGPNGFTSSLQNPTRTNATTADAGTYSVTVTVNGCTSAAGTTNVVVNAIPATPTASNDGPYCEGATISLSTPTVSGATYSWTGPNGFVSSLQNPTRSNATTADAGTYSVTVTVNGCTSAAGTTNVVVNAIPATPTASNDGPYCEGATISLSTPTVSGTTYSWTGPNGFTSSLQNPTRSNATTADAGTYSVTVTVNGCTSAAGTTNVVVNPTPATPTASNGGPYCEGATVSLSTPTVSGATYSWTGPNGFTSGLQNPTRTNATSADAGTYSLTVTVNGCTSAAGTTDVVVNPTTLTVNQTSDEDDATPGDGICETATGNGFCTLRAAITEANNLASCGALTINFNLLPGSEPQTIFLENALPTITRDVTIQGTPGQMITVDGNTSYRIFDVASSKTVSMSNLVIADADDANPGAGLRNDGGTVNISNCAFTGNFADDSNGGAIANLNSGTLNVWNSTFSMNEASNANGGAIYVESGTATLTNDTISENAADDGGGVYNQNGTVNIRNTIIANNYASTNNYDVQGTFVSQGHNLISIGDGSNGFVDGTLGDHVGSFAAPLDAGLGSFDDYGGGTLTYSLFGTSIAIEGGDNCVLTGCAPSATLTTDQRGVTRPQGALVDIGAFEVETYIVNTTSDHAPGLCQPLGGPGQDCTLREAINVANSSSSPVQILFNIPTDGSDPGCVTGICTIALESAQGVLPAITQTVSINGYSQTGATANTLNLSAGDDAALKIVLSGANLGANAKGLDFCPGSVGSEVKGLVINNFQGAGIRLKNDGFNIVAGNFIGTDVSGMIPAPNGHGVLVVNGLLNLIGGDDAAARNIISANTGDGVQLSGDNTGVNSVEGNYIGTGKDGDSILANNVGVNMFDYSGGNTIGCEVENGDNLISGNTSAGVRMNQSDLNTLEGNLIGTDKTGSHAVANGIGVDICDSSDNAVGYFGFGSVISGNTGAGVRIKTTSGAGSASSGNFVYSNKIGINAAGDDKIPNDVGVVIQNSDVNDIGSGDPSDQNIISGNKHQGILLQNSSDTIVFGNFIGTNAAGTAAIANAAGVEVSGGTDNEIGCTVPGSTNVISGNTGEGVELTGSANGNFVQSNFIGLASDGTTALANGGSGVEVYVGAHDNVIGVEPGIVATDVRNRAQIKGGSAAAQTTSGGGCSKRATSNSQNTKAYMAAQQIKGKAVRAMQGSARVQLQSALTGRAMKDAGWAAKARASAASKSQPKSSTVNKGLSVARAVTPSFVSITGANTIAHNGEDGVRVTNPADINNLISQNSIYANVGLGINLGTDGVTPNNSLGHSGPNNYQNFPVINYADPISQNISFSIDGTGGTGPFTIEFFVNDGCDGTNGEGQTFIGSTSVSSGGPYIFTALPSSFAADKVITATATDSLGNTSEFSQCKTARPPELSIDSVTLNEGNSGTTNFTFTVSLSSPSSDTVTVQFATQDGVNNPATGGAACGGIVDYISNSGTLTFDPGDTSKLVTIAVCGDNFVEADETCLVNLSNNTNAPIANGKGLGTITGDDCPTSFTVNYAGDTPDAFPGDGNCGDSMQRCSLRAAIDEANAFINCPGTIDINFGFSSETFIPITPANGGELFVQHNVNINGPTGYHLFINGNGQNRAFVIDGDNTVSISNVTINDCIPGTSIREPGNGGAILNFGTLTLNGVLLGTADGSVRNSAVNGGGIANITSNSLTLVNTTISGNLASGNGGGIFTTGDIKSTNSTIAYNTANNDNTGAESGGGIFVVSGDVFMRNTIVSDNLKNLDPSGSAADDISGSVNPASANNVIGAGAGSLTGTNNNQVGVASALLKPLQENGGPTQTHALTYKSPAVDKGDACVLTGCSGNSPAVSVDQRGQTRTPLNDGDDDGNTGLDVGAYERQVTETRDVAFGPNSSVDIVDAIITFPCVLPCEERAPRDVAKRDATAAARLNPAVSTPTASLSSLDPATLSSLSRPANVAIGSSSSPALPAFEVTTTASYTPPATVCFYLPSFTDPTFFAGLKVLHREAGPNTIYGDADDVMVDRTRTTNPTDFANKLVCSEVNSFSAFAIAHTVTPTAANGSISGQILDGNGGPVEGVAVRMSGTQNRLTITDAFGNYRFDSVDTNGFYVVTPARANFSFSPAQKSFSQLAAQTEATFTATASGSGLNPLDTSEYFVRQHYLDFLGREPDEAGFNFWVSNIESCGTDLACREVKRIDTSAAFFLSIEFQHTGFLVYRAYEAAYGDIDNAPVPMTLRDFTPDTQKISRGIVVNQTGWQQSLETNKQAFMNDFVQRARFTAAYPVSLTPAQFVDKLFATAHVESTDPDYAASVSLFGTATDTSNVAVRAQVLRRLSENASLTRRQFNRAFVLMEYFGYLRRDPNSGRDADFAGYSFWLDKLNIFNGNFENAEMVKAFLSSPEYRGRFPR